MTKEFKPRYINEKNDTKDVLRKCLHDRYDYAIEFTSPCIDSPIFLEWLMKKFFELGGILKIKELKNLEKEDYIKDFDLTINCCGHGAIHLCIYS
jgi:hypothetical protein